MKRHSALLPAQIEPPLQFRFDKFCRDSANKDDSGTQSDPQAYRVRGEYLAEVRMFKSSIQFWSTVLNVINVFCRSAVAMT